MAAVAAAVAAGAAPEDLAARASSVTFSKLRGEHLTLPGGTLVVNDCYNANPVSMRAALDYLATIDRQPKVAVLGMMGELGPGAADFHREVGAYARSLKIDVIIGVGPETADYEPDHLVEDQAAAVELLEGMLGPQGVVLVKGSRAAGLEVVTEGLARGSVGTEGVS
jgi:UDP-N-acetylmuramoyl-tripeptide--D-alanyl-D-alanine ligase